MREGLNKIIQEIEITMLHSLFFLRIISLATKAGIKPCVKFPTLSLLLGEESIISF